MSIRIIGDPVTRYKEDPVRMLRAIRFAAKLDFSIEPSTAGPIKELAHLLKKIPPSRLFEEYMKLFLLGSAVKTYEYLTDYGLLSYLFSNLIAPQDDFDNKFIHIALANTDCRVINDQGLSPAFLISVFLIPQLLKLVKQAIEQEEFTSESSCWMLSIEAVLNIQQATIAIPRKFSGTIRDILELQYKLDFNRTPKKIIGVFEHIKFRAAYDMLLLRGQAGDEEAEELAQWWTTYMGLEPEQRLEILKDVKKKATRKSSKKKSGRRTKFKTKKKSSQPAPLPSNDE